MILQYFKKKENIEKQTANKIYKDILKDSNLFINNNSFFLEKNFNTSFEVVSIFLIIFIKLSILKKYENHKKINEYLVSILVSDLDESLREKGIGDMSIGKYVKSYVKKFYFRISKFPDDNNLYKNETFIEYLKIIDLIKNDDYVNVSRKFNDKFTEFINSRN